MFKKGCEAVCGKRIEGWGCWEGRGVEGDGYMDGYRAKANNKTDNQIRLFSPPPSTHTHIKCERKIFEMRDILYTNEKKEKKKKSS